MLSMEKTPGGHARKSVGILLSQPFGYSLGTDSRVRGLVSGFASLGIEPLLMIPGYLVGGLPGAIATIALFAALLTRSTVRLFEDEGIDDATTRAIFPFVALGPPILFYAARIWPEVPAAFCFVTWIDPSLVTGGICASFT